MTIRLHSYLKRNRFGVYYFRRVIPLDLRSRFAFGQIARSTRTCNSQEAQSLALRLSASVDLLFSRVRDMAKQPKPDPISQELIVDLDFDLEGLLTSVRIDAKPGEEEAASRLVPVLIQAARDGVARKPAGGGARFFEQIDKYLEEQARGADWRPQTVQDVRGDFDQFKSILGDMPVSELRHEALNKLRDTLLRLPGNINKMTETRGKSVDEILALGLPAQSANTVKKKWGRLITFFNWMEGKGLIERNFAQGKKPKAKAQSYEKFTRSDLSALFESSEYKDDGFDEAFKYWLPVIGVYTGARMEEIAQLHLADFRQDQDTGIHVAEITDISDEEDGAKEAKNLKNTTTARTCPLHSALIDAGLLTYIDELKFAGYDRLFPELTLDGVGKVGPRASEWFADYRRSKSVGALMGRSRKVFHSLRHTMNATLQKEGVTEEIREALCGHAPQSVNSRVYGGKLPLGVLKGALELLDYGLLLKPYKAIAEHDAARKRGQRRSQA
jgi:integrase